MKVFHNCIVVLEFDSATSYKEKAAWRKKITDYGGVISYVLTRKVSGQNEHFPFRKFSSTLIGLKQSECCPLFLSLSSIIIHSAKVPHCSRTSNHVHSGGGGHEEI